MHKLFSDAGDISSLDRKTWIEIDLDAIHHNVSSAKEQLPQQTEVMAVVKANGYGHGAVPVAREAILAGATWLGVAVLHEAIELRNAGIDTPILLLGYLPVECIRDAQKYGITITVPELDYLLEIKNSVDPSLPKLSFHVKIDTGMSRLGMSSAEEILQFIEAYQKMDQPSLHWNGVFTHLATADEEETSYWQQQQERFQEYVLLIGAHQVELEHIHMSNSAGIYRGDSNFTTMVRLGISMYGLYPSPYMKRSLPVKLKSAFSLHTHMTQVKRLPAHRGVSYGATYVTVEDEWIGVLPIGYADGWSRALSHQAEALVGGVRSRLIGRICMDQCMITLERKYPRGQLVTLIGEQEGEEISIDDLAEQLGTINYEIPCMLSYRIPRLYHRSGKYI